MLKNSEWFRPQTVLIFCVYLLVGFGIVMIYSASAVYADHTYNNPQHFLFRQILYTILGTAVFFVAASIKLTFWRERARWLMLFALGLLLLVYMPGIGHSAGGARRWIDLGFFNFQPAEFAKVVVCIYLADYLSRKKSMIQRGKLKVFVAPMVLVGSMCALILLQPDLGSTAFIFLSVAILIFLVGIQLRYVWLSAAFFLPVLYFLVIRVPYRFRRISAYINPWDDPQGEGFQIIQSFLAFGLGGFNGVGLGQGMQKLFYLPSSYNDFIFSIVGEELGLLGLLFLILVYLVIFIVGIFVAEKSRMPFEKLLVLSLTMMIVLQAVIHMMVATGLIPTKGLPLPFVSFGGTSLIFNFLAMGIVVRSARTRKFID